MNAYRVTWRTYSRDAVHHVWFGVPCYTLCLPDSWRCENVDPFILSEVLPRFE